MLFTIVFYDGITLNTSDAETAIRACNMMDKVDAVVNTDTKEVLFGSLPDCMLSEEELERNAKARKRAFQRKREAEYKEAYLKNKLYEDDYTRKSLDRAERDCVCEGLTDIILSLAKEQCDKRYKLFKRGLITKKELLEINELKFVIPKVE